MALPARSRLCDLSPSTTTAPPAANAEHTASASPSSSPCGATFSTSWSARTCDRLDTCSRTPLDRRGGSRHRAHAGDTGHGATGPPRLGGSLVPSFQRHGVRLTRVFVQSGVHGIDDVTVVVSKVRRQYSVSTRFDRARRVPAVASSALCPISRVRSRPQHGQKPHPLDDDE